MTSSDFNLIFSLISIGFFGGFTHCIGMCGPFVISQVSSNLSKTKIENYQGFQKISGIALFPYHLGRLTTYATIGLITNLLSNSLDNFIGFKFFSSLMLLLAIIFFVNLFIKQNNLSFLHSFFILPEYLSFLRKYFGFFKLYQKLLTNISSLLKNSSGFKGYLLGLILGFLPCGMLYGSFAISGNFSSPILAFIGMALFGLSTFFALFWVGFFAKLSFKLPEFKIIANIIISINILMLFKMFLKNLN